jgi:non-ribosomal peptide synthetase component E (peptide arylation enzyme)
VNRLADLIPGWPSLREMRFSDEQADRYHRTGHWDHRGLDHLLADHAHRTPERMACTDGRVSLTYAELYDRARAVAGGLLEGGLHRADVVLVAMANDVDHVLTVYALAAAGLVTYELPTDTAAQDIGAAAARTRAGALITDHPISDDVRAALGAPGLIVGTGGKDPSLAELAAGPPGPLAPQHPDDVATLIRTSGTTGTPKIVMRSANCSLAMARAVIAHSGLSRRDVLLTAAPLQGGVGFINGIGSVALTGCALVIAPDLGPAALLELIAAHRVTRIATLPTIASRLLHVPGFESTDITSVEVIQTGGAFLSPDAARAIERAFGCTVTVVYGAIDVGAPTMVAVDDPVGRRHSTLGRVVDGAELAIVDPAGRHLGPGEVGEVVMRGPDLALGYFGDDAATATVFDAAGWGHLGDLGTVDEDGYLRLVGRVKEIINRGGKKISIAEVEAAVTAVPGVREAAAVSYPDSDLGERCAAFLVTDPDVELDLAALRRELSTLGVAKALWPERVQSIDALPVSGSGKVNREALAALLLRV